VRHLDQREPVGDLDGADVAPGQATLAGDRADQVLRPDPGPVPRPDEQPRHSGGRGAPAAWLAGAVRPWPGPLGAGTALGAADGRLGDLLLVRGGPAGLVRQLHGGHGHLGRPELLAERLDDGPEPLEVLGEQGVVQCDPGQLEPPGVQVGDGGHLLDGDPLPGHPFDGGEHPVLPRLGQGDRDPLPAGPADPADAVHVRLGRRRDVVVDHVAELLDVQAACRHVRGDQQVGRAGAQPRHHPVALLLTHAAVIGAVAAPVDVR
jgi:hypothetical protein